MKVVQINATCGVGSTGKICVAVSKLLNEKEIENYILCTNATTYANGITYMTPMEIKAEALKSRLFGNYGFHAHKATKKLITHLEAIQPDVVHLHNLHGHNCNLSALFGYLKQKSIKTYWTFHDCWAFTGYCMYFDLVQCDRWKEECGNCPQRQSYSWFSDRSRPLLRKKKALFDGLDLTIITPSKWLATLAKQSFLHTYPIKVIHNGIDLSVFKPVESDFRVRYHLENKIILLGVAFPWAKRKGLDVFVELAEQLSEEYAIVLVGTNDTIDKQLPDSIICIHKTQDQYELAQIYAAADVFLNPTREENYPTVNMEAIACGTPVVTFDTGGSGEMLTEDCGIVVNKSDVDAMKAALMHISANQKRYRDGCLKQAPSFDQNARFEEYTTLYMDEERNR